MHKTAPPPTPTFREALGFWLWLGIVSFGGPAGQIAIMHDFLVDKKRWLSNSKFLHALNYCMLLPGPEAQQLATYTGWMLYGIRGGLAAGILFVLPSAIIMWGLSILYVTFGQVPAVQSVFEFLKPAVVAIVVGAIVKIGKKSLQTPLHYAVAAIAFVAIYFLNVPFPVIIFGAILLGVALTYTKFDQFSRHTDDAHDNPAEQGYVINRDTVVPGSGFSPGSLVRQTGIAALLWLLPLALFFAYSQNFGFWKKLCLFFTNAAFVTFGGAYAVLPYVAQMSVEKFGFAGAPLIERTQANPAVKSVLNFATAAVTGVILSLCLYLGRAVVVPNPPEILWLPLVWTVVSLAAFQYFRVNLMVWIGVSVVAGLLKSMFELK